jgi:photosystem II stability/assembly factor-like uncharacterized protein
MKLDWRVVLALTVIVIGGLSATPVGAQQYPASSYQELRWRSIGPFRGGRTRAVAGVPGAPNVFYIGAVNGGVWKSDDYGRTWTAIFDSQPTQSIGAIAVAPSNPDIIYVASGEGLQRPDLSVGNGIYKSTDAGKTWTHLGLRDGEQIPAMVIDPADPNRLFAAVLGHPFGANEQRGIFRSVDGGKTWERVLYKDENTGGSDIEMDPSNPDVLYAGLWEAREGPWEDGNSYSGTGGALFKSSDGGSSWKQLTNGLPKNLVQINVTVAASDSKRIYATVATNEPGDYASAKGLGFYRSDDAGESWVKITDDPRPAMRIGGGDLPIPRADPKNPDVVYSASIVTERSTDGGKTWSSIRGAPGGDDYQNLWINPNNPKIILLVADQGALVTVNGGETWSSWYNQPTAQIYHVSATEGFPYRVCGGQQESGSVCISTRGNDGEVSYREWHPVGAIEYGYVTTDPLDPDIIYGAGRTEVSKYHWSTGQVQNVTPFPVRDEKIRTVRTQPLMFSPVDPHILYTTANFVFKTTDGGQNWSTISPDLGRPHAGVPASLGKMAEKDAKADLQRGAVYALAPSFKTAQTLWAGTDDGLIWLTRDGGRNWKDITPPELTAWSKVTQIAASRFDEETAYASVSRLRIDDLHPYIYRTHDGGKSWKLIVSGLPDDAPVDTVREDPVRKGMLFAGTETGVFVSFDGGEHWQSLQQNLPHTSMRDLWIHDDDLIVATHGRGFWILDDISPLREVSEATSKAAVHLFKPASAIRARRSTYTDTPVPPDEPLGDNPPDGAIVDYWLAKPATGTVTLEILDGGGKLVRRFSSEDKPELSAEQLQKQLIPIYWVRPFRSLSAAAGMHRWVWDLRYAAPVATSHDYPISAVPGDTPRAPFGPLAAPGQYTVRLTADGASFTVPLTVKMDPRVKMPEAGLAQMFQMQARLADVFSRSSIALMQARSAREQIEKLDGKASDGLNDAIEELGKRIAILVDGPKTPEAGKGPQPTLSRINGNVSALYAEVDRADAAPTTAQLKARTDIERDFSGVAKLWEEIRTKSVPALNQRLKDANLAPIVIEENPRMEEEAHGDEE